MEFDLLQMFRDFFQTMHENAGVFLLVSTGLFIVINILRGKVSLGGKPVKIPWITDKFNSLVKEAKTYILLALFALIGVFTTLQGAEKITIWLILDGLLAGGITGMSVLGLRQGYKQGRDGLKKITTAIKEKRAKKKNETPT